MTSLDDLYVYYCRRCGCKPNSRLRTELQSAYEAAGDARVLKAIDISDNYVGPKGFQPVMLLLANLDSVERLDASNNMLTRESLESLVEVASRHRGLREIALSRNAFHDSSADLLLHLLRTNWRITDLRVEGNDLTANTLAKFDEQLTKNRAAVAQAARSDDMLTDEQKAVLLEREKQRYTPWVAKVDCSVEAHRSGGSLHFASWRENPQYHLFLSHSTQVTIQMQIPEPIATRLCGFAVLQGTNLRRVVDVTSDPSVIIAESPFHDAIATVTLNLKAAPRSELKPYVIVPLTFQPRKAFHCTITASIAPEIDGGLVKLEALDPRGDWFVNEIEGQWVAGSAGGSLSNPSWRRNPMYRASYAGSATVGKATLKIVVTKANDDDDNDERAVGVYLLAPDAKGRRPIRAGAAYPQSIIAALDHRRAASQVFTVERPCDAKGLDFFIMPSTEVPHQTGHFQITVYSTCSLNIEESPYAHGWATQRVGGGVWDEARSGGSRQDNPTTWPHNPCYEIDVTGDGPVDIHMQLEAKLTDTQAGRATQSSHVNYTATLRGGSTKDVGILFLQANDELTPVAQSPWVPASSATWGDLWITELAPGKYYAVPVTRVAGMQGTFEIEVTSSRVVHVSLETPLNVRLRQRQLQKYEEETSRRVEEQRAAHGESPLKQTTTAKRRRCSSSTDDNGGGYHGARPRCRRRDSRRGHVGLPQERGHLHRP
jgi:hypothetical protein